MTQNIAHRFGSEWDIYREIIPLHKEQFLGWINPIPLAFFKGKRFIDAGCGIGRNSLWPLQEGAASAYAFDYDERTVKVAKENLKEFNNCQVEFKSIYDLSIHEEYDIVFCIGVLHHLAHPRRALENLVRALKPGGTLILWTYAHEGNEFYLMFCDPFRKFVTSRLPVKITRWIAQIFTVALKAKLLIRSKNPYEKMLKKRSLRHMEAMVFDQLLPSIANYWRKEELQSLVQGLPLQIQHLTHVHGMSWAMVATKN